MSPGREIRERIQGLSDREGSRQDVLPRADNPTDCAKPAAGDKMQHIVANSFEIDINDAFPRVVNWHEVVTAKPFTQTVTSPELSICTRSEESRVGKESR